MSDTFEHKLPEDTLKQLLKGKSREELLLLTKSNKVNDSNKLVINAILQNFKNAASQKADASEIDIGEESPVILNPGNTILQKELAHDFPEFLEKGKNLLREIASHLIDPTDVRNLSFLENPDDPKEHSIPRHQYGIITHSITFAQATHDQKNWEYLKQQGIDLTTFMQENIDGLQKEQLLPLIGILHDVAKFFRNYTDDTLQSIWNHNGHEIKGAEIIANDESIKKYLAGYGITPLQQQYIQNATAIHYELGKIRDALQRAKLPYTIASTQMQAYKDQCHALAAQHPDLKTEIGLLPYFDKLATVETIVDGIATDEQIEKNQNTYITGLKERNLPEYLLAAAKQKPVNIMMAVHYLILNRQKNQ